MKQRPLNRLTGLMGFVCGQIVGAGICDWIAYLILPRWGYTPEFFQTHLDFTVTLILTPVLGCGFVGFIGCGYYQWLDYHPPRWIRVAAFTLLVLGFAWFWVASISTLIREHRSSASTYSGTEARSWSGREG
jgi:hypothetical protein